MRGVDKWGGIRRERIITPRRRVLRDHARAPDLSAQRERPTATYQAADSAPGNGDYASWSASHERTSPTPRAKAPRSSAAWRAPYLVTPDRRARFVIDPAPDGAK